MLSASSEICYTSIEMSDDYLRAGRIQHLKNAARDLQAAWAHNIQVIQQITLNLQASNCSNKYYTEVQQMLVALTKEAEHEANEVRDIVLYHRQFSATFTGAMALPPSTLPLEARRMGATPHLADENKNEDSDTDDNDTEADTLPVPGSVNSVDDTCEDADLVHVTEYLDMLNIPQVELIPSRTHRAEMSFQDRMIDTTTIQKSKPVLNQYKNSWLGSWLYK